MNPKFKPFSDGIYRILFGVFMFFQGCWFLAAQSDWLLSDYVADFYVFTVVVMALSSGLIFLGVRKYRQNRLLFRDDQKTKLMTYTELAVTTTAFSLFGVSAYFRSIFDPSNPALLQGDVNKRFIIHPYQGLSFELLILAYLLIFVSLALFYAFLPKQVLMVSLCCFN